MRALRLIIEISKGIAREENQRRRAISVLLASALGLVAIGVFPLWPAFPAHPIFFAIYWFVCGWLTICVLLLAIYDLLMVIRRGREERDAAHRRIFEDPE